MMEYYIRTSMYLYVVGRNLDVQFPVAPKEL